MDPIIQNGIPSGKERKAKQEAPMDFADLEAEILEFVEDAYQQNYFYPRIGKYRSRSGPNGALW